MKPSFASLLVSFLCLPLAPSQEPLKPDGTETKSDASQQKQQTATNTPRIFSNYDAESFQKLEEAQQKIDPGHVNHDLLSAAVFHETNQRRLTEKLPPLDYEPKLGDAAKMQAVIMEERGSISHVNPESPGKETPTDRLPLAGLEAGYSAENVATAFALAYPQGKPFYTREENGKTIFSLEPDGTPVPPHTYVSFAAALLDSWMASSPHRKNILSPEPKFLGAASQLSTKQASGMPLFYCAQVFFTPLKPKQITK